MEAATEYSPAPNEKAQKTLTGSWEGESPVLPWILPEKIEAAISTLFSAEITIKEEDFQ